MLIFQLACLGITVFLLAALFSSAFVAFVLPFAKEVIDWWLRRC